LNYKKVTAVGLGDDFIIALGLTLPNQEIARLSKSTGILRQKTEVSAKDDTLSENRFNIKRMKRASPSKKSVGSDKRQSDVVSNGSHLSGKINFHRIQ
jgi:hypothetical protein